MRDPEGIRKKFREPFIAELKKNGTFTANWIEQAFLEIPRHLFIRRMGSPDAGYRTLDRHHHTDDDLQTIYSDIAILIHDPLSSSSQPWLMAQMLGHLDVKPDMKVLEIGTGSGFNAGLLSIGTGNPAQVHSIDIQPDLIDEAKQHLRDSGIDGVQLLAADAARGWPDAAPFDRIIGTVGCPDISPSWLDQLTDGGVLLLPFSMPGCGDPLLRLTWRKGAAVGSFVGGSHFMSLQGRLRHQSDIQVADGSASMHSARNRIKLRMIRVPGDRIRDLTFFLGNSVISPCRSGGWHRENNRWQWRLNGPRNIWSAICEYSRGTLTCSGSPGAMWNLVHLVERWKALGMPKITDYRVEVSDAEPDPRSPADWIDARPNVRLRISLPL